MKGILDALMLAGLVALFLVLVNLANHRHPGNNPEQWFHVGVSRLEAENGVLRKLPQAQDLGWAAGFPDQASLFHAATTVGWKVDRTQGVIDVSLALGCLVIAALYLICRKAANEWISALAVGAGVLANPFVVFRLGMVRPEALALFCLLLLVVGSSNGSRPSVLVAALAFALASAALYLPLLLVGGSIGLGLYRRRAGKDQSQALPCAGAALAGLALGVALCPNNPSAWLLAWQELIHPLPASSVEMRSQGFETYLHYFGASLALAIVAVTLLAGIRWRKPVTPAAVHESEDRLLLAGVALLLVAGAFFWPRLALFGIPLSAPGIATAVGSLSSRARAGAVALALLWPAPALWIEFSSPPDLHQGNFVDDLQQAIRAIPNPEEKKIFNCDFNYGDHLLALRPDLHFVDALDATLLQRESPTKYLARRQALQGKSDPYGTLQQVFQADYVLCAVPALDQVLDLDPRAKKLFSSPGTGINLYAL